MVQLLDLPNDVLTFIILLTPRKYRIQLFRVLCLTCHRLQSIAQPILYSTFDITESQNNPAKEVVLFGRTLIQRPNLANGIRSVDLYITQNLCTETSLGEDLNSTLNIIQRAYPNYFGRNDIKGWRTEFNVFPHVLLLLVLLPRLEALRLRGPDVNISQLSRYTFNTDVTLTALRSADIEFPDRYSPYNLASFGPLITLLQAPHLIRCVLRGAFIYLVFGSGPKLTHLPLKSLSSTHLELVHCIADAESLKEFILAHRKLRHFTFRAPITGEDEEYENDGVREDPGFDEHDLGIVITTLAAHSDTLEALDLRFNDAEGVNDVEKEFNIHIYGHGEEDNQLRDYARLPSLADFGRLRYLTMDYHRLPSIDYLPEGLRELILLDCRTFEVERGPGLSDLCQLKDSTCPFLESLDVQVGTQYYYAMMGELDQWNFQLGERPLTRPDMGFKFRVFVGVYVEANGERTVENDEPDRTI